MSQKKGSSAARVQTRATASMNRVWGGGQRTKGKLGKKGKKTTGWVKAKGRWLKKAVEKVVGFVSEKARVEK